MPVDIFETANIPYETPTGAPKDIFESAGISYEPEEVPKVSENKMEEAIPGIQNYVKHQERHHIPGEDFAESVFMGTANDVLKVHNFLAKNPIAQAVLRPIMGEMEEHPEFELEKEAPMPTVAKVTQALAPFAIPFPGAAIGKGIAKGLTFGGAHILKPMAAKMLAESLPKAEGIGKAVANTLGRAGTGAAHLGAIEKIFGEGKDEDTVKKAAIAGAILHTVPHTVFSAPIYGLRRLTNNLEKFARESGQIPVPEQVDAIVKGFSRDNVLSLPDIAQSPKLSSFYHGFLTHMPFSGIAKKGQKIVETSEKEAANAFNGLIKGEKSDPYLIRENITNEVKNISKDNYKKASTLYDDLYKEVDKSKTTFDFKPTNISNFREQLTEDAERAGKSLSEYLSPDQLKALNNLDDVIYVGRAAIKGVKKIDLKGLYDFRSEYGKEAFDKLGTKTGRFWRLLNENLDNDIGDAIGRSDNKELISMKNKATDYYRENVVPFTKKSDMRKLINKDINLKSPTLEKTLTNTVNRKVLNQLPKKTRAGLIRLTLDKNVADNGEYVTPRLVEAFNKLDAYDKNVVMNPETKQKFEKLIKNYKISKPSFDNSKKNIMDSLRKLWHVKHAAYISGIGAGLYGTAGIKGLGALPISAAVMGRILSSPKLLKAYAEKGAPVPFEKGAPQLAKLTERGGQLETLRELRE